MKKNILASILVLAMASTLPVWADETSQPESTTQPATEITQEKLQSSTMGMKEARMKMEMASSPSERQTLMHDHMQQMKDSMKMMEKMGGKGMTGSKGMMSGKGMMGGKGMMSAQEDNHMKMMEDKRQMMMEMMRGLMSQQEMMMKNERTN